MSTLNNKAEQVRDRESFIQFAEALSADFAKNSAQWENRDAGAFISALAGWVEDMDGYYQNQNKAVPQNINWEFLRDLLLAAKVYE